MVHLVAAAILAFTALQEPPSERFVLERVEDRVARLVRQIGDPNTSEQDRFQAFGELEHLDVGAAARVAPSLLQAKGSLRFHAAWVLASTGPSPEGLRALREMAKDRGEPLTLPIQALGRLRDPGSHEFLRHILEDELARSGADASRPRRAALMQSLSEYEDDDDTELLTRAFLHDKSSDWLSVDQLGRTGGSAAVLPLREVFLKTGRGWGVTSAGLALARCGEARGIRYVEEQLASAEPARPEDRDPRNGETDDPYGPKAKHFLLERFGSRRDEIFVMQLLSMASDSEQSFRPRALAWSALLRIHSSKYRAQVLQAAWKDASIDGASRLIALDDEQNARAFASRDDAELTKSEKLEASAIRTALAAPGREKRRWCEPHGYGF